MDLDLFQSLDLQSRDLYEHMLLLVLYSHSMELRIQLHSTTQQQVSLVYLVERTKHLFVWVIKDQVLQVYLEHQTRVRQTGMLEIQHNTISQVLLQKSDLFRTIKDLDLSLPQVVLLFLLLKQMILLDYLKSVILENVGHRQKLMNNLKLTLITSLLRQDLLLLLVMRKHKNNQVMLFTYQLQLILDLVLLTSMVPLMKNSVSLNLDSRL